jgi:hypothetical protein
MALMTKRLLEETLKTNRGLRTPGYGGARARGQFFIGS